MKAIVDNSKTATEHVNTSQDKLIRVDKALREKLFNEWVDGIIMSTVRRG